jgi:methylase of polypeptide subunit release factors
LIEQRNAYFCVLDLCTGTGAIPLLFHHEFYSRPERRESHLALVAMDISPHALGLAEENRQLQLHRLAGEPQSPATLSLSQMKILQGDVLLDGSETQHRQVQSALAALQQDGEAETNPAVDVLVSNPPYISSKAYRTTTARSVRHFEPKLALLPPINGAEPAEHDFDGDVFYPRLLGLAERLQAKVVLLEVGDMEQAQRIATMAVHQGLWERIEIWRDQPDTASQPSDNVVLGHAVIPILGAGHGRAVFAYRTSSWAKP